MRRLTEAQTRALSFVAGKGGALLFVHPVTEDRLLRRRLIAFDRPRCIRITDKGRAALNHRKEGDRHG
ncbi:hypothetical protein BGCPKDLD_3794 [Methylorubrum suomiense]|uniref:MarR family transcriptional regulator n=1 Tax=Methylorubrum suomiense TaxID=144191 RepID=A0ABQ4UXX1_9HYPH|nr:hypothetical protein BGCPKDLD_3794 [Methylorubrum suomiense]